MDSRNLRSLCQWSLAAVLAVGMSAPAVAQDLQKDARALTKDAKDIDRSAKRANSSHAADRLAAEFSSVSVKSSASDPGHPLTSADVQALRDKGLGYGEVAGVLSLYSHQSGSTFYTLDEIAGMKQRGQGWGRIAKLMGYKNLGSVRRDMKQSRKDVDALARAEVQTDKADAPKKIDKAEKIERIERPERPEKPGR